MPFVAIPGTCCSKMCASRRILPLLATFPHTMAFLKAAARRCRTTINRLAAVVVAAAAVVVVEGAVRVGGLLLLLTDIGKVVSSLEGVNHRIHEREQRKEKEE